MVGGTILFNISRAFGMTSFIYVLKDLIWEIYAIHKIGMVFLRVVCVCTYIYINLDFKKACLKLGF